MSKGGIALAVVPRAPILVVWLAGSVAVAGCSLTIADSDHYTGGRPDGSARFDSAVDSDGGIGPVSTDVLIDSGVVPSPLDADAWGDASVPPADAHVDAAEFGVDGADSSSGDGSDVRDTLVPEVDFDGPWAFSSADELRVWEVAESGGLATENCLPEWDPAGGGSLKITLRVRECLVRFVLPGSGKDLTGYAIHAKLRGLPDPEVACKNKLFAQSGEPEFGWTDNGSQPMNAVFTERTFRLQNTAITPGYDVKRVKWFGISIESTIPADQSSTGAAGVVWLDDIALVPVQTGDAGDAGPSGDGGADVGDIGAADASDRADSDTNLDSSDARDVSDVGPSALGGN